MAVCEMNAGQLSEMDRYSGWEVSQGMEGAGWGYRDDRVREGPWTGGWRPSAPPPPIPEPLGEGVVYIQPEFSRLL